MKRGPTLSAAVGLGGAVAGALVTHLLDPDRGRARRSRLRSQATAGARRSWQTGARATRRRVRWARGRLAGTRHDLVARFRHPPVDLDDNTIAAKVRSEALRHFSQHPITIDVADAVVHLRGEIASDDIVRRITAAVDQVAGVRKVESHLHLPGSPAPNKEAALHS